MAPLNAFSFLLFRRVTHDKILRKLRSMTLVEDLESRQETQLVYSAFFHLAS